ncbi:MAG: L-threonine 3-dehydrogenase [Gammaproteobacteria bacterium RIFCSPHIGHO2_12_FULL_35_23]|nr:MAG: L-threonine 3-dehydrogenase [Gammaproteobacteria bacterium RIFCSPHIGHO2_12_FULL_35_23]
MKCLAKLKKEPGIWLHEAPLPQIGHNDVLIKVKKTAICGTDIHIYNWDVWAQKTIQVPLITGHEFVGTIAELGIEVKGLSIGDRVSGEGHITCGFCRKCRAGRQHLCRNTVGLGVNRQGCFAEYVCIPANNVYRLPNDISDDVAAILDPLGNAAHTALSFDLVGEDVLITGAGPVGIMTAAIAAHVGARKVVVTDINDYRLALAKKMGATRTVNIKQEPDLKAIMKELNIKEGFDVGLEVSGNVQAFSQMLATMNHGGHIALLGILPDQAGINWTEVIFKGLIIKGIYGREMYETWYKMVAMLQSGLNIASVITHVLPMSKFHEGFDIMRTGQSGKVILDWEN